MIIKIAYLWLILPWEVNANCSLIIIKLSGFFNYDTSVCTPQMDRTALHYAVGCHDAGHIHSILVEAGADDKIQDLVGFNFQLPVENMSLSSIDNHHFSLTIAIFISFHSFLMDFLLYRSSALCWSCLSLETGA